MNYKLKKGIAVFGAFVIASSLLCGCQNSTGSSASTSQSATSASGTTTNIVDSTLNDGLDTSDMFSKYDLQSDYTDDSFKISLADGASSVDKSGVDISGDTITITKKGTYIISGSLSDGQIIVDADGEKVQLVLNNASISNKDSAAIFVKQADKVLITLAEGTSNSLSTTGDFEENDYNIDATVFAKDDLTINGQGSLTVTCNSGDGIVCKDDLKIVSGNVTVSAKTHGLVGKDSLRIKDGTISITTSEKDGLHSSGKSEDSTESTNSTGSTSATTTSSESTSTETVDYSNGYIYIEGGSITINAGDDGIHANGAVHISGGEINITNSYEGIEGRCITIAGGIVNVTSSDDGLNATSGSGSSDNTLDAGNFNGGNFNGGNFNGGNFNFGGNRGKQQISTDGSQTTSADSSSDNQETMLLAKPGSNSGDGSQQMPSMPNNSGDGSQQMPSMPGNSGDGSQQMPSMPDNSGDSSSNGGFTGGKFGGGNFGGGKGGGNMGGFENDSSLWILIQGGTVTVNASGDGIDSNGSLKITGGSVYIAGPSADNNGALDYNGDGIITGGTVVAVGSAGMAQSLTAEGDQKVISTNLDSNTSDSLKLTDSTGKVIVEMTPNKQYRNVVISSAELKSGQTYTLTCGSQTKTVTIQ